MKTNKITGETSDGYHTFDELYEHRTVLWIALCRELDRMHNIVFGKRKGWRKPVWRSKIHSDGSSYEGWFILGMNRPKGYQMTYHIPMSFWKDTGFAATLKKAPEYDGHTSKDVLERIRKL